MARKTRASGAELRTLRDGCGSGALRDSEAPDIPDAVLVVHPSDLGASRDPLARAILRTAPAARGNSAWIETGAGHDPPRLR
jgi:hypothetical protein